MTAKRYQILDFGKFVACICIIAIHVCPLKDVSEILSFFLSEGVARIAVPFFFITSSYLYFKGNANWKKYCLRMLKYYTFWFVVCLPSTIYYNFVITSGSAFHKIFYFLRKMLFASSFQGSWFILSCVFCAIVWKSNKKIINIFLWLMSVLFFLLDCFSSSYYNTFMLVNSPLYEIFSKIIVAPQNNIFCGMIFFGLGKLIYKYEPRIKYIPFKCFWAIISIILVIIETSCIWKNHFYLTTDCMLMLPLAGTSIFIFMLENKEMVFCRNPKILDYVSKFSSITYPLHLLLLFYLNAILKLINLTMNSVFKFIIVFIICIVTSWILLKFEKKYPLLKYAH